LFFGLLGWAMKHFRWPRPPLVLGFILGGILERYMFISIERYGIAWMARPLVILMLVLSALSLARPVLEDIRAHHGFKAMASNFGAPRLSADNLFPAGLLCLFLVMMWMSLPWSFEAKIVPAIVGIGAIAACSLSLLNDIFSKEHAGEAIGLADKARAVVTQKIHMDIASKTAHLPASIILVRGLLFFGWMLVFLCSMAVIGLIPTVPLFIIAYMRLEGPEPWRHVVPMAAMMVTLIYVVFDQILSVPWPPTLLGTWIPALKIIPSV